MNPTIGYHLAQAHLAGLRHQAQRETLAHAARQARRARTHQPGHPPTGHPAAIRRLSVTLAAVAAAALALPACQGTATAASHHHHAAQATVQQAQNGITPADLRDLANIKRDLLRRLLPQQAPTSPTPADLRDLANIKRDLFQRMAKRSPNR